MASSSGIGPISQQYSAAATVPLIKSPSLWLPQPIELPNDIHPLPEDITAYFVYPFTLEEHVLSARPAPHEAIAQQRARNAEILHRREVEEEQREKQALHKLAPGYNPAGLLVPKSAASPTPAAPGPAASIVPAVPASSALSELMQLSNDAPTGPAASAGPAGPADPMDDLVKSLEEMDNRR